MYAADRRRPLDMRLSAEPVVDLIGRCCRWRIQGMATCGSHFDTLTYSTVWSYIMRS
jgi:hypothetical protein